MEKFRLFDGDNQRLIGAFNVPEKQKIVSDYESRGFDVSEDHDGDMVFFKAED